MTGSFVVLPFLLTVLIITWIINTIGSVFGPGTWFGDVLISGGAAIVGDKRELVAFLIGAAIALAGLWFLGLVVRSKARRALDRTIDNLLMKVPIFRSIYRPVSQVVRVLTPGRDDFAGMPVVMCRLGGREGADVPALLASKQVFQVGEDRRLMVYLPTSPLPAWGALVLVSESSVVPVPGMDADGLIKLYFSFGVLAADIMPASTRGEAQA